MHTCHPEAPRVPPKPAIDEDRYMTQSASIYGDYASRIVNHIVLTDTSEYQSNTQQEVKKHASTDQDRTWSRSCSTLAGLPELTPQLNDEVAFRILCVPHVCSRGGLASHQAPKSDLGKSYRQRKGGPVCTTSMFIRVPTSHPPSTFQNHCYQPVSGIHIRENGPRRS